MTLNTVFLLILYSITSLVIYMSLLGVCILLAFVIRKTVLVIASGILLLVVGSSALSAFGFAFPNVGIIISLTPLGMNRALFDAGLNPIVMVKLIGLSFIYLFVFMWIAYLNFSKAELK